MWQNSTTTRPILHDDRGTKWKLCHRLISRNSRGKWGLVSHKTGEFVHHGHHIYRRAMKFCTRFEAQRRSYSTEALRETWVVKGGNGVSLPHRWINWSLSMITKCNWFQSNDHNLHYATNCQPACTARREQLEHTVTSLQLKLQLQTLVRETSMLCCLCLPV